MKTPWVWRLVERRISRDLPTNHVPSALGDLLEDFNEQVHAIGRLRAEIWLIGESVSLTRAYRRRSRQLRGPGRSLVDKFLMDELKLAARRILHRPGASVASVVTLACGIAAGAATWSLLNQVLLNPLPIASPDRLMLVGLQYPSRDPAAPPRASNSHVYSRVQPVRDSEVFERIATVGAPGTAWTELIAIDG